MSPRRGTRSPWARRLMLGGALLPTMFAGGCESWPDCDNVFRKRLWGWMQGDAGSTVVIGSRLLWVFGDSAAHADGTASQHGSAQSDTRQFTTIFGNSIALHYLSGNPYQAPAVDDTTDLNWGSYTGNVRYYARNNTSGAVRDVTYEASQVVNPSYPAFGDFRQIVVRSSKYTTAFPGSANGSTTSYGSTARADVIATDTYEPGTGTLFPALDENVVSGYNAFRSVHAVKGHAAISEPGNVLVTYYVWSLQRCNAEDEVCFSTAEDEPDLYYSAASAGATDWEDGPQPGHLQNSVPSLRSLKFPLKYM